jgi:integrase
MWQIFVMPFSKIPLYCKGEPMIRKKKNKNGTTKYEAKVKRNGRTLSRRFDSEREASHWVNEVRYKRDNNLPLSAPVSIQVMFDKYLEYAKNRGRAGSTLKDYRGHFKNHLLPFYRQIEMKTVTVEEHEELVRLLVKKGLSAATCNRIRSLMSVIYSTAIKKRFFCGAFKENPFVYIEKLPELRKKIAFWDNESINQFLESNRDSHYYPFWLFLLNTGLRIGEACALHWEQVDLAAGIVSIDRTWSGHENKIVNRTKSRKIRHVGLNKDAVYALSRMVKDREYIFSNPDGTPLLSDHVRKNLLPKACKEAGVKKINPHGFRHTYASQYMMGGGNIWDLSKILGHSTVQLTELYYAHFSREHVLKRARVITQIDNVVEADFGRGVA